MNDYLFWSRSFYDFRKTFAIGYSAMLSAVFSRVSIYTHFDAGSPVFGSIARNRIAWFYSFNN